MKSTIIAITIHASILALVVLDEFWEIQYAGNVAIFALWSILSLSLLMHLADSETIYKKHNKSVLLKIPPLVTVITLIAIGWTWTAIFFIALWLSHFIRRTIWEYEKEKVPV